VACSSEKPPRRGGAGLEAPAPACTPPRPRLAAVHSLPPRVNVTLCRAAAPQVLRARVWWRARVPPPVGFGGWLSSVALRSQGASEPSAVPAHKLAVLEAFWQQVRRNVARGCVGAQRFGPLCLNAGACLLLRRRPGWAADRSSRGRRRLASGGGDGLQPSASAALVCAARGVAGCGTPCCIFHGGGKRRSAERRPRRRSPVCRATGAHP
jgi:hypothetical protein